MGIPAAENGKIVGAYFCCCCNSSSPTIKIALPVTKYFTLSMCGVASLAGKAIRKIIRRLFPTSLVYIQPRVVFRQQKVLMKSFSGVERRSNRLNEQQINVLMWLEKKINRKVERFLLFIFLRIEEDLGQFQVFW